MKTGVVIYKSCRGDAGLQPSIQKGNSVLERSSEHQLEVIAEVKFEVAVQSMGSEY